MPRTIVMSFLFALVASNPAPGSVPVENLRAKNLAELKKIEFTAPELTLTFEDTPLMEILSALCSVGRIEVEFKAHKMLARPVSLSLKAATLTEVFLLLGDEYALEYKISKEGKLIVRHRPKYLNGNEPT